MKISLVTPAGKTSRAGNRTTAMRWARMLRELGHTVEVTTSDVDSEADMMIALHAWRSAGSVARFRARHPRGPLIVALTGTDIYHHLSADAEITERSLELADGLVGLHDLVPAAIPARHHDKLRVMFQSAVARSVPLPPLADRFEILVVGHLRAEKDPLRAAAASRLLPASSRIEITHLGGAHAGTWAERARAEMAENPRYTWAGDVPGSIVRRRLTRARLMVLSSRQEGGANVISEALVAGLPVIASDIPGSVGLLGDAYPGYFPAGDEAALCSLMLRAETEPGFLASLRRACAARAPRFAPASERESLNLVVEAAIAAARRRSDVGAQMPPKHPPDGAAPA